MNVNHMTVYYDKTHDAIDGKGFCVDHDGPDDDGCRSGGLVGARFATAMEAGLYIAQELAEIAQLQDACRLVSTEDA